MFEVRNSDCFTLAYYEGLITKAKKTLRVIDSDSHTVGLILRHDIDFSVSMAYEFSRIEIQKGVVSSYYVMVTSERYNVFSRFNVGLLQRMAKDGFEIGLHFDPLVYGAISASEAAKKLQIEARAIRNILEIDIYSYCLHNPTAEKIPLKESKLLDACNDRIFGDDRYISDSSFSFKGKDPKEWVRKSETQLVQFLSHPFLYFGG